MKRVVICLGTAVVFLAGLAALVAQERAPVFYSPEPRSVVKYEYGFPSKATKVVELTKYGSGK